jgi:hypothetical protein
MRFGSCQVEQPNKYVRVFDKFALLCKPKGEAILPNDKFRGGNQRLEGIVCATNNSTTDDLTRDRDDSRENYGEAQSLHRLPSSTEVRTLSKTIAEVSRPR